MKNVFSELPVLKNTKYYSTQELSKLFRANQSTIKRWADSGKLKCFKTPGGHRKYTPDHISEFISNFHYEIISQDINFAQKEEKELLEYLILKSDFRTLSEVYFSLASKAEKENLYTVLHSCHTANIPLVSVYDEIVAKAVRKIFVLRNQSKITLAEEHVAKNSMLESLLQYRMLSQKVFFTNRTVVLGASTGGIREVVLACAEHLLTMSGWRVINLGTNVPLQVLNDAIKANHPKLVCVCKDYLFHASDVETVHNSLITSSTEVNAQLLFSNFDTNGKIAASSILDKIQLISFSTFKEMLSQIFSNR